jgi:hypothetical protein
MILRVPLICAIGGKLGTAPSEPPSAMGEVTLRGSGGVGRIADRRPPEHGARRGQPCYPLPQVLTQRQRTVVGRSPAVLGVLIVHRAGKRGGQRGSADVSTQSAYAAAGMCHDGGRGARRRPALM